jgi:type II secretory pathway pseudopilin PulG
MKFLRTLLIIVVVLAVVVGILSAIAPTQMSATRSVVINASKEVVWNNTSKFENIKKWSYWARLDSNMKTTLEGADGTVGAKSSWDGNKDVGAGSQTFTKIEPMTEVDQHLQFIRPFKGQAEANMSLADTTGGVLVTWGFSSAMPRPFNVMGLFMNPSASIGKDYDAGLKNLKELCEQEASMRKTYRGYTINVADQPMKTYVGKRETVSFADISKFFQSNLPKIGTDMKNAGIAPAGAR